MKEGAKFSVSQRGFNMPGRGAGLLANAGSSSTISWCRGPGHPGVRRRLVGCYCLGLPIKSLGNLSESFRMALMTALTVDEEAFALSLRRGVHAIGRRWL